MNEIERRKIEHVKICLEQDVENSKKYGLAQVDLIHGAIFDGTLQEADTSIKFLNHMVESPIFISPMTGGTPNFNLNNIFIKIAKKTKTPIFLGSMKILFENEAEYLSQFDFKKEMQNVPVFGNIGLLEFKNNAFKIEYLIKKLNLDGISLHLNMGQELFQLQGDRDFRGIWKFLELARRIIKGSAVVKETGFGIGPQDAKKLLECGFDAVDLAAGGTNWILVEGWRGGNSQTAKNFANWGFDLATLLLVLRQNLNKNEMQKVFASGGIKNGVDAAKCIALGAGGVGIARELLKKVFYDGIEKIDEDKCVERGVNFLNEVNLELKIAMTLTASKNLSELNSKFISSREIEQQASTLIERTNFKKK